jgi:hypothetical protein
LSVATRFLLDQADRAWRRAAAQPSGEEGAARSTPRRLSQIWAPLIRSTLALVCRDYLQRYVWRRVTGAAPIIQMAADQGVA